jgi:hypothetical protein
MGWLHGCYAIATYCLLTTALDVRRGLYDWANRVTNVTTNIRFIASQFLLHPSP